jgi:translation initiation factor IF-3
MAEEKTEKKTVKENKTLVAQQLPTQNVREVIDDKGDTYTVMTTEEALTEILDIARQLKKGLL